MALETGGTVDLSHDDGTMPVKLLEVIEQHSHGSRRSRMVICPLFSSSPGVVRAFVVLALASWRPYDDDYQRFIRTLTDQMAMSQRMVAILDDEARKCGVTSDKDSTDTANLSLELQTRMLEVEEGEQKLARFTSRSQVALGILDAKGSVVFANPLWRDLTQLEPADDQVAWAKAIIPEDLEETYAVFARMITEASPIDFHLRFNKRWKAPHVD
jgi:PAS domain-containing protein